MPAARHGAGAIVRICSMSFRHPAARPRQPASLPLICAAACTCIAVLDVAGWTFNVQWLTSVAPGLPTMVPMTAVLVALASLAIARQARRADARAPAALVAGTAVLVMLAHALDWAPAPFGFATVRRAGPFDLSSPVSALMFLIEGSALLCCADLRRVRCGQWLSIGLLLLAVLTLAGYLFRDTALYALLPARGTSVLSTFAFILGAVGMLALRPREGIMAAVSGAEPSAWVARRLLLSALAMPVLLGAASGLALHLRVIDAGTAIAFLVWGMVALFTVVVWHFAVLLYHNDLARREAERQRESALAALREADARKDDFLALIAHELRNPLAPVRAAAELMRMGATDPAQLRRTSDIISRQVDHMVHLVDDLLDLSRVSRGLITLEKAPVDLAAAVADALEQARPMVAGRRHRLDTELPDAHPSVLGDHKRLVQVVANLLTNAAKYTPEGGHIRLALGVSAHEAELRVQDNGIGIDASLLPRVFDAFIQGTRSAGRAEGGLGLGLALVKRLAELHGGTVAAYSAGPGQGSTFVLVLPLIDAAGAPGAHARARTQAHG
jgi:signal transduction histidine kinase